MPELNWYWDVLIGVGVVLFAIAVLSRWDKKRYIYCPNCDAEITREPDLVTCPNCGAPLSE